MENMQTERRDPSGNVMPENRQQQSPFPDSEGRPTQQQNPPVQELIGDDRTDFERSNDKPRNWNDDRSAKLKSKADRKLQEQKAKIILVKDVNKELFDNTTEESDAMYPFYQLEIGQGFFVPADDVTQDQLVRQFHSQLAYIRQDTAEIERDANGDQVWETVVVKTRPRDKDGNVKLQGDGTDIVGADHVLRPVLINPRRFIVKRVSEGYDIGEKHEVEDSGVMVIRVA